MSEARSIVLSFEDARRAVEQHSARVHAPEVATVDLIAAAGRVLAEPVLADRNLPPFPRSTRDGYAVRAADVARVPATLDVIGEIKAGESLENIPKHIGSGQAASIMTGAPVPSGADAVVMVEYTAQQGTRVEIHKERRAAERTSSPPAQKRSGAACWWNEATRLNDAAIALAATAGQIASAGLQPTASRSTHHGRRNCRHRRDPGSHADSQLEQLFTGGADSRMLGASPFCFRSLPMNRGSSGP